MTAAVFQLDDSFARELVGLHRPWQADPVSDPSLVILNETLAHELGLDIEALHSPAAIALLAGNDVPADVTTVAQAYAGHQFGGYSPQLGDGRALLLGEIVDHAGIRRDLHLKGSGRTPFARGGDGRAALGPMLREYVIGEAMHALGIPTTRALAVVATGDTIVREVEGRHAQVPGAILARVASSHLRVGTFQFAAATGERDLLREAGRPRDRPPCSRRCQCRQPGARTVRPRRGGAGVARGEVDGGRVHPRRDEHRQHHHLGRDDRLRPVRVHGRLRPGDGVQLDRPRRPLRLRQPAGDHHLEPRPSGRGDAAAVRRRRRRGDRAATAVLQTFPERFQSAWSAEMHAKLGLDVDTTNGDDVIGDLLDLDGQNNASTTRCACGRCRRRSVATPNPPARCSTIPPDSTRGRAQWLALLGDDRDSDRGGNGSGQPDLHPPQPRRRGGADRSELGRRAGALDEFLDAVTHPFDERPGLERYARPAPDAADGYRTFCGT